MEIKLPKAILFDWDNTLADTWPTITEALSRTFIAFGKEPWTLAENKQRVHRSLRDFFPELFGDEWEKAGEIYLSTFTDIHLEKLAVLDGAKDVLEFLLPTDIYVALVSNKTGSNLRAEVDHMAWNHFFEKVIGARDAEADKPSPEPVLMALEGSGIRPGEDVWFIGDSITDMECAYNTGCVPIFFGDQDLTEPRFVNHQPQLHIQNHQQLLEVLQKLHA